jgi:hypothetical protein
MSKWYNRSMGHAVGTDNLSIKRYSETSCTAMHVFVMGMVWCNKQLISVSNFICSLNKTHNHAWPFE